jgi:hypothetical protein
VIKLPNKTLAMFDREGLWLGFGRSWNCVGILGSPLGTEAGLGVAVIIWWKCINPREI